MHSVEIDNVCALLRWAPKQADATEEGSRKNAVSDSADQQGTGMTLIVFAFP